MLALRASGGAAAFLSMRHVIDASCISPNGIGEAKQIGRGGDANAPWVRRRVRTGRRRYSARRTRSTLLSVALGAAIIGGLTLAWSTVHGDLRPKLASAPTSPQNTEPAGSRELVDRLLSQVEALKSEIREFREGGAATAAGSRHCSHRGRAGIS
jgi:hypothetical protein